MYRWLDEKGQIHVTDDLNGVPPAKRTEAQGFTVPKATTDPDAAQDWEERNRRDADTGRRGASADMRHAGWHKDVAQCQEVARHHDGNFDAYLSPSGNVAYVGSRRASYEFRRCMEARGHDVSSQ